MSDQPPTDDDRPPFDEVRPTGPATGIPPDRATPGVSADRAVEPTPESAADTARAPVAGLSEDDAAVADAVSLLSGPALDAPHPRPSPSELEQAWGEEVTRALAALRADLRDKRVGLAISGGGSLGSFEAGALRFLYDHAEITPVAITGNSAGALNAAKLAHGDLDDGTRAIDEVERLWRAMRINPDLWEPEPWLERIIDTVEWATAIRGQAGTATNATNAMRIAMRVVGSLVLRPEETDGTFDAVKDALAAQSLLSLRPVADLIDAELDIERLQESGIVLRMGVVSLESGELRYVTETGALHDRHDQPLDLPPVAVADAILASASIPVAFPPVLLGDEHYVDGGAREILPIEIMVQHLDVDRVIGIAAGSPVIEPAASFADRGIIDILRRVSAEIATNETLRKELSPPGGWGPEVRLVVPDINVHDAMTIDPALIAISFDYGWMRAADSLLELGEVASALATELTRTRIELRKLAGPLPSLFDSKEPVVDTGPPAWSDGELTLTARLREQTEARRTQGLPVPPSLLGWLDAT